jgi:hypothetical protein
MAFAVVSVPAVPLPTPKTIVSEVELGQTTRVSELPVTQVEFVVVILPVPSDSAPLALVVHV